MGSEEDNFDSQPGEEQDLKDTKLLNQLDIKDHKRASGDEPGEEKPAETKVEEKLVGLKTSSNSNLERNLLQDLLDNEEIPELKLLEEPNELNNKINDHRFSEDEVPPETIDDEQLQDQRLSSNNNLDRNHPGNLLESDKLLDPRLKDEPIEEIKVRNNGHLSEIDKSNIKLLFHKYNEWEKRSDLIEKSLVNSHSIPKSSTTNFAFNTVFKGLDAGGVHLTVHKSWIGNDKIDMMHNTSPIYHLLRDTGVISDQDGEEMIDQKLFGQKYVQDFLLVNAERLLIEEKHNFIETELGKFLDKNSTIVDKYQGLYKDEILADSDYRLRAAIDGFENKTGIDWNNDPRIFSDTDHSIATSFEIEGLIEKFRLIQKDLGIADSDENGLKEIGSNIKVTGKKGIDSIIYINHPKFNGFYSGETKSATENNINNSTLAHHNTRLKTSCGSGTKINKFIKIGPDQKDVLDLVNNLKIPPAEAIRVYGQYFEGMKDIKPIVMSYESVRERMIKGNLYKNVGSTQTTVQKWHLPYVGIRETEKGSQYYKPIKLDLPLTQMISELKNFDDPSKHKVFNYFEDNHPNILRKYFKILEINKSPWIENSQFNRDKVISYVRKDLETKFHFFPKDIFSFDREKDTHKVTKLTGLDFNQPILGLKEDFKQFKLNTDFGDISFQKDGKEYAGVNYFGAKMNIEYKYENGKVIPLDKGKSEEIILPIFTHRVKLDASVQNSISSINSFVTKKGFTPIIIPDGTLLNSKSSGKSPFDFIVKNYLSDKDQLITLENGDKGYLLDAVSKSKDSVNNSKISNTQVFIPLSGKSVVDLNNEPLERVGSGVKRDLEDKILGTHITPSLRPITFVFNKTGNRLNYLNQRDGRQISNQVEAQNRTRVIELSGDSVLSLGVSGKPFRKLENPNQGEENNVRRSKQAIRSSVSNTLVNQATNYLNSRKLSLGRMDPNKIILDMAKQLSGKNLGKIRKKITAELGNGQLQAVHLEKVLTNYERLLKSEIPNLTDISNIDIMNLAERMQAATAMGNTRIYKTYGDINGEVQIITSDKLARKQLPKGVEGVSELKSDRLRAWYNNALYTDYKHYSSKHIHSLSDEFIDPIVENPLFNLIANAMDIQEQDKFIRFFKVFDNIVVSYLKYTEVNTPTIDKAMNLAAKYWSIMVPLDEEGKIGDSTNFKLSKEEEVNEVKTNVSNMEKNIADVLNYNSEELVEQSIISTKYNQVYQREIEMNNLGRPIRDDDYVKADWKDIVDRFKEEGWSMRMISKKIQSYMGNQVYGDYNMKYSVFLKLQGLANFVIPYSVIEKIRLDSLPDGAFVDETFEGKINYIEQIDPNLSEMLGVLHGDGTIAENHLTITLDQDEKKYSEYVSQLTLKTLRVNPIRNIRTDCNATDLIINRKVLVNELTNLGMQIGNKTKNQAEVPDLARKSPEMSLRFVKGLFDTDGSIFFHRRKTDRIITLELNFSNANRKLTKFFAEVCESNGIKVSGDYNKGGTNLSIHSREGVVKFYEIVDSEKIKNFMDKWSFGREHLEKAFPYDPENDFTKK